MSEQPNFLIFIVDEKRYPTGYESDELKTWMEQNLKFETELANSGIVFHNHYTNTNACCPARATFHTGQYPNVHGVTQTDGVAKQPTDPNMTWLEKFTVPTIGNYFREAGYKTFLKGKWHVSDASIKLNTGDILYTFDKNGDRLLNNEEFYLEKNVLSDFGYDGWIGPEPHGQLSEDAASSVPPPEQGRDVVYAAQINEQLAQLQNETNPWLLMASFVNPHDITTFGLYSSLSPLWNYPIDPTLPSQLFTEDFNNSFNDPLNNKPLVQNEYRGLYSRVFQPMLNLDTYHRLYYTLQKYADNNMMTVWQNFKQSKFYNNTIVLFFSDHGEYLSAHGLEQKWFTAYQEAIHIPLIISSPLFGNNHRDVTQLTSHIDLLPTLLGLAGFNSNQQNDIRKSLGRKFKLNLPPSGTDLSSYIRNPSQIFPNRPVYFTTQDNPTSGASQINVIGQPYPAVPDPASVEAIIVFYQNKLWKFVHTYSPNTIPITIPTVFSLSPITYELYDITDDFIEVNNLYGNPQYAAVQTYLTGLLATYSFNNRI